MLGLRSAYVKVHTVHKLASENALYVREKSPARARARAGQLGTAEGWGAINYKRACSSNTIGAGLFHSAVRLYGRAGRARAALSRDS